MRWNRPLNWEEKKSCCGTVEIITGPRLAGWCTSTKWYASNMKATELQVNEWLHTWAKLDSLLIGQGAVIYQSRGISIRKGRSNTNSKFLAVLVRSVAGNLLISLLLLYFDNASDCIVLMMMNGFQKSTEDCTSNAILKLAL